MSKHHHIVLAGAGYSNLKFINYLRTSTSKNITVSLVSEDRFMLYSGKMPGLIAGMFQFEDCTIDVETLCNQAHAEFIQGTIQSIDTHSCSIQLQSGESIFYDVLSINIGGSSAYPEQPRCIGVKPITQTYKQWKIFEQKVLRSPQDTYKVHIIGGGVAGVEIACGIKEFFKANDIAHTEVHIYEKNNSLCNSELLAVRKSVSKKVSNLHIKVHLNISEEMNSYFDSSIPLDNQLAIFTYATQLPSINHTLKVTDSGYFEVNHFLQSTSHENVFASGDCSEILNTPLPKAGVYSIRQSEFIIKNILAFTAETSLEKYVPQKTFLKIINFCDGTALLSWKWVNFTHGLALFIKNYIDDSFLRNFKLQR